MAIKPDITYARLQLHYAIQFIAATGIALADPQPDYSHAALHWNPDQQVFQGVLIHGDRPFRIALDPVSLTSLILDAHGSPIAQIPLDQTTMAEGLNWLKSELRQLGVDADRIKFLDYPPNDFPDHPLAHGAVFDASYEADRQTLVQYYANTHTLLYEIMTQREGASPVQIWSHHFDMATLIALPGTRNGEPMSIGVGMSPGDGSYDEPYWYVSPYPYPDATNFPPLEGNGTWHTNHWVGAVLKTSQLTGTGITPQTNLQVKTFLNSAIDSSQTLLG